jgi:hypothetical protein
MSKPFFRYALEPKGEGDFFAPDFFKAALEPL